MSIRNLFTQGIKTYQNLDVNNIECETLTVNQGSTIGDIDAIQVRTDLIIEKTLGAGVNIEGVIIEDGSLTDGAVSVIINNGLDELEVQVTSAPKLTIGTSVDSYVPIAVNEIVNRSGQTVTVQGIEFKTNKITFPGGIKIDDTDGNLAIIQFANKDVIEFDRAANIYNISTGNSGALNPDIKISQTYMQIRNGLDTISSIPLEFGLTNATSIDCLQNLRTDVIEELTIDNGIEIIDHVNVQGTYGSSQQPEIRFGDAATSIYPNMQLLPRDENDISVLFDSYHDGTNYISSFLGSNFQIQKSNNRLNFNYSNTIAPGGTVVFSQGPYIDSSGDIFDKSSNALVALDETTHTLTMSTTYFAVAFDMTVRISIVGNIATILIPSRVATTSVGITSQIVSTALPAAYWPAQTWAGSCFIIDNNISQSITGYAHLDTGGKLRIQRAFNLTNFTASSTCGWSYFSFSYSLI